MSNALSWARAAPLPAVVWHSGRFDEAWHRLHGQLVLDDDGNDCGHREHYVAVMMLVACYLAEGAFAATPGDISFNCQLMHRRPAPISGQADRRAERFPT